MNRIKTLFVDLPRCTAEVGEAAKAWHEATGKGDGVCPLRAKYDIDGRILCTRHAGQRALQILTEPAKQSEAEDA